MKRLISLFFILSLFSFAAIAQLQPAPKFASKAQKAILSINSYDKKGDLMKSGTAFYIGPNGEAIADYSLFKNASKAIVIEASGKQYEVESILGADDTYSLVRFHVNTKGKAYLNSTQSIQGLGANVYAVNYLKEKVRVCPQGMIESLDSINGKYAYYKFSVDMGDQYVGAPVFNADGEVIGLLHSALGQGIISAVMLSIYVFVRN